MVSETGLWTILSSVSALFQGRGNNFHRVRFLHPEEFLPILQMQFQRGDCWVCSNLLASFSLLVHPIGHPLVRKPTNLVLSGISLCNYKDLIMIKYDVLGGVCQKCHVFSFWGWGLLSFHFCCCWIFPN